MRCSCGAEVELGAGGVGPARCGACGRELVAGPPADVGAPERCCPFCCEVIRPSARKCPHCQEYLDPRLAPAAPVPARSSPLAIAAFVVALASPLLLFVPGPVAALLGVGALLDRRATAGRGMAVAGLVLGIIWTLLLVLVFMAIVAGISAMVSLPSGASPAEPLF